MRGFVLLICLLLMGALGVQAQPRLVDEPKLCLSDGGNRYDYCLRLKDAVTKAARRCAGERYCHNRVVGLERYALFVLKAPDESIIQKGGAIGLWSESLFYLESIDRQRIRNDFWMVLTSGSQERIYQRAREVANQVIAAIDRVVPNE